MIRSNDFGFKNLDPVCGGYLRKLTQQDAAESASLKIVCDCKGDLSPLFVKCNIERMAHHAILVAATCNQSKGLVQVRFSMSFGR
jgi:hypothetical protein